MVKTCKPGLHDKGKRPRPENETKESSVRVLIVNSEWIFRKFIRSALETQGDLTVIGEAADGAEALHLSQQLRPDVVLTDMDLLDGHSLDATRQIKARLPGTRVIMFSALDGETYHHAAKGCGADAFVSKGAPISGILGLIRNGKQAEAD
jgi:DNA-binding NarL/FixJ family response regulator